MALLTTVLGTEKNLSAMMKGYNEYLVPSPPWAETALPNEDLTLNFPPVEDTALHKGWENMIQLIQHTATLDIKHLGYF